MARLVLITGMVLRTYRQLNQALKSVLLSCALLASSGAWAEPELRIVLPDGSARVQRPYRIECEVTWEGEPSAYAILPAETNSIDWGIIDIESAKAFVRDGTNVVSQVIEIVPDKTGSYEVPEIRVKFLNPEATSPAESAASVTAPSDSSVPPPLRADPFIIEVRAPRTQFWISGGLGASLFLGLAGWWYARKHARPRQTQDQAAGSSTLSQADTALHRARKHRLDGSFYEYYVELGRAAEFLSSVDTGSDLAASFKARASAVGYKGERPNDDEMDSDFREVERALARKRAMDEQREDKPR